VFRSTVLSSLQKDLIRLLASYGRDDILASGFVVSVCRPLWLCTSVYEAALILKAAGFKQVRAVNGDLGMQPFQKIA
jgi:hypothetical protein